VHAGAENVETIVVDDPVYRKLSFCTLWGSTNLSIYKRTKIILYVILIFTKERRDHHTYMIRITMKKSS